MDADPSPPQEAKSFRDSLVEGLHKPTGALVTRAELDAAEEKALNALKEDTMASNAQEASKIPQFWIDDDILDKLCKPWRNSIIIKLLGKSINFFTLKARLARDWRTEYEYEIQIKLRLHVRSHRRPLQNFRPLFSGTALGTKLPTGKGQISENCNLGAFGRSPYGVLPGRSSTQTRRQNR